jgi:hypothetical protein
VLDALDLPAHEVNADDPIAQNTVWVRQQWDTARLLVKEGGRQGAVLVIDEVQKLPSR